MIEHRSVPLHHILYVSMHDFFFLLSSYSVVTKESTMNFSLPHGGILSVEFCGLYFVICLILLCFGLSRIENLDVFVYYKIPFVNILQLLSVHYILKAWIDIFVLCSSGEMWAGYCSRYNSWLWAGRSGDRIPVGARFSTPVQTGLGPTQPPVQWVLVLYWGKVQPGCVADSSPSSRAVVKKEWSYTSTSCMGHTACTEPWCLYKGSLYLVTFTLGEINCYDGL